MQLSTIDQYSSDMVHCKHTTADSGEVWTVGGAAATLKAKIDMLACVVFKYIMSICPLLQIYPSVPLPFLRLRHFVLKEVLSRVVNADQNAYNTRCLILYCIALEQLFVCWVLSDIERATEDPDCCQETRC